MVKLIYDVNKIIIKIFIYSYIHISVRLISVGKKIV